MESRYSGQKVSNLFFGGYLLKDSGQRRYGKKTVIFFFRSFFRSCGPTGQIGNFFIEP